jgi:hypothetical protein
MRRLTSINVGFVGVLSCLVLMLALVFSTSVASAHSTQAAVHSQVSVTSVSTLKDAPPSPSKTCTTVTIAGETFQACSACNTSSTMKVTSGGKSANVKHCHHYFPTS